MRPLYAPKFEEVASAAFTQAGFEFDQGTLQVHGLSATAECTAQGTDLYATYPSDQSNNQRALNVLTSARAAYATERTFHDLLRDDTGLFNVKITDRPGYHDYTENVRVRVITSPDGFNQVQRMLGRTPGVDAFELASKPSEDGAFKAGQYIESFAVMHAPAAELRPSNWLSAEHDREPDGHVLSWIGSPPELCRATADRAQYLVDKHGDKIHLPDTPQRPAEIGQFVDGVDDLLISIRRLFNGTFKIVDPTHDGLTNCLISGSPAVALYKAVREQTGSQQDNYVLKHFQSVLGRIGLVAHDASAYEHRQQTARIASDTVAHIARLLLTLEEVVPKQEDSPRRRQARLNALQMISSRFSQKLAA